MTIKTLGGRDFFIVPVDEESKLAMSFLTLLKSEDDLEAISSELTQIKEA